ncbi:MAG: DUF2853 family protein [Planctomycetota bacterium]
MSDHLEDVKKYTDSPKADCVESLVGHLRLAMTHDDGQTVAATDKAELERIKDNYCRKTLDITDEEADSAIAAAAERMAGTNQKNRVTFYYLIAEEAGKLDRLA